MAAATRHVGRMAWFLSTPYGTNRSSAVWRPLVPCGGRRCRMAKKAVWRTTTRPWSTA